MNSINFEFLGLISVPVLILLLILLRRKRSAASLFFFSLFYIYLVLVLGAIIFPIPIGVLSSPNEFNPDFFRSRINLRPFYFGQYATWQSIYYTSLPNILLTVPFGFGIHFTTRLRGRDFLWLPLAVGIGLEGIQLLASLVIRYPYRVLDINDMLLNAAGVLVGYAMFRMFAWLYLKVTDMLALKHRGLGATIYDTAAAFKSGSRRGKPALIDPSRGQRPGSPQ